MKLTRLDLSSFRSYVGQALELDAPKVYVGATNGKGKTAIREAIRWALLGHAQGTDRKGAGTAWLVPTGEKGVAVSLTLDGIGRVARAQANGSSSFSVEKLTGSPTIQEEALLTTLNTTPAILEAVLDTSTFLNLHHADAKALILQLLAVQIAMGEGDEQQILTLEDLDAAYTKAFEERKLAKKTLQGFRMPQGPVGNPQPKVEDIDRQLLKRRGELEGLMKAGGKVSGKREMLERRIQELSHPLSSAAIPPLDECQAKREELEIELASLKDEGVEPTPEPTSDDVPARLMFLSGRAEALRSHKPSKGCVLDESVPCETAKIKFTNQAKEYETEHQTLSDRVLVPATPSPVVPIREAQLRFELRTVEAQIAEHEKWAFREAERTSQRLEAQEELAGLPDTSEADQAITTLRGRIEKGEGIRRQAMAYWQASKEFSAAEEKKRDLEAEVQRLEEACAALGPNGIRVPALQQALAPFEQGVNGITQLWGWTVNFQLEPWEVLVNGRPADTYSKSEQYRIGLAIQLAIARLSELNFAVVDELDVLDIQNRSIVARMLREAPLEQILMLGTREDGQTLPPGVLAYRLGKDEAGRSVVTERTP